MMSFHVIISEPKKSTTKQFDRIDNLFFETYANKFVFY